jgi:hypothetical protein
MGTLSILRSRANEPATQSSEDRQDKNHFRQRCPAAIAPLPLLGGARNASTTILHRSAAGQGQGRPVTSPVMHILRRKPPQGSYRREKEKGLCAGGPRCASRVCRQRRGTSVMSQTYSQTAKREHVSGVHQGQCVNVSGGAEPGLRTMICWGRDWCY